MPAKLDLTKPLRLIGIQIYEGTHENVRKVLSSGWYPARRTITGETRSREDIIYR